MNAGVIFLVIFLIFILFLVGFLVVIRAAAHHLVPRINYFFLAFTWALFAFPLILIPFDLANIFRTTPIKSPIINFFWIFYLYVSIALSQLILPVWEYYVWDAHFTWKSKLAHSFLNVLKTLLVKIGLVIICFVVYILIYRKSEHSFNDFKTLGIRMLNCVYYLIFFLALSYGLIKLPIHAHRAIRHKKIRRTRETVFKNVFFLLRKYHREYQSIQRFYSLLGIIQNKFPGQFVTEFETIEQLIYQSQIYSGLIDDQFNQLTYVRKLDEFDAKQWKKLHKEVKTNVIKLQQTQSRYYYLMQTALGYARLTKKIEAPLLETSSFFFQYEQQKKGRLSYKFLVFGMCCMLTVWILFLESLEFVSTESLIVILTHLWASQNHSLALMICSSILLIISSVYILSSVFFFMMHFNVGHITGIRLNHRTSLPSLISLTRWLSMFTFPVCYFIFQILLTPAEYQGSYFFDSLKTSDFLFFWGKPFPWLLIPFLFLLIVFFALNCHKSIAEKVGFYFLGVKNQEFPELTEAEQTLMVQDDCRQSHSNSATQSKVSIFSFVEKSPSEHIRNVKMIGWENWPKDFHENKVYEGFPVQARLQLLSFENYLYNNYDIFFYDCQIFKHILQTNNPNGRTEHYY